KDTNWIYAYWEIAPSSIEEVRKKIGREELAKSSYVLRMYDVTMRDFLKEGPNHWFDIEVGYANNWYINLWCDNVTYCGELGIRTPDGRFFLLARSNYVTTPRLVSSSRNDLIWMEVKDNISRPFVIMTERKPKEKEQIERKSLETENKIKDTTLRKKRRVFLTEEDIKMYYSKVFPLLQFLSLRQRREINRGENRLGGKDKDTDYLDIREFNYGDVLFDKFILKGISRSEFLRRILLGSSQELVVKGGASEFFSGASELRGGASEKKDLIGKKRKFFFEIWTELIVYGRSEPDAEVWLGNKNIKLRPDGTFTLRFSLPDTKIPLDFIAYSYDKIDRRSIITSVERTKTLYNP
ncbi:MAG: DUF4912 domain-containing protein, partial [Candidatus Omnitrophica bacterium]|nr:DUF4912 domain-containing protein [Candidatus Omnitrophota bacterium]